MKSETPNKNTLDFGCGKGIYAKSVINFSPKKLTAIDISEKAIKIAKEVFFRKKEFTKVITHESKDKNGKVNFTRRYIFLRDRFQCQ